MVIWKKKYTWKILMCTLMILSWHESEGIHCMGSSKPPSWNLSYYHRFSKDASLITKATACLLISVIRLEEGGEVHMHCTRELVHTRTITLHYYSKEMYVAEIISQVFKSRRNFLFMWKLDPSFVCLFWGGVPMSFSPFNRLLSIHFFIYIVWVTFGLSF